MFYPTAVGFVPRSRKLNRFFGLPTKDRKTVTVRILERKCHPLTKKSLKLVHQSNDL